MDDERRSVHAEYGNEVRITKEHRPGDAPLYRFEAPMMTPKASDHPMTWENPRDAECYAHVYLAVNSFREEKSGRRGIPPEVASEGKRVAIAYATTMRGCDETWAARMFDLDEQRVAEYRSRVKGMAKDRASSWPWATVECDECGDERDRREMIDGDRAVCPECAEPADRII